MTCKENNEHDKRVIWNESRCLLLIKSLTRVCTQTYGRSVHLNLKFAASLNEPIALLKDNSSFYVVNWETSSTAKEWISLSSSQVVNNLSGFFQAFCKFLRSLKLHSKSYNYYSIAILGPLSFLIACPLAYGTQPAVSKVVMIVVGVKMWAQQNIIDM